MIDLKSITQGADLGTSPHGLSVELPQTYQKTREVHAPHSLVDASEMPHREHRPQRSEDVASGGMLQVFGFTEEQRRAVSFALLNEAADLEEGHEAHEPEVQEAIRHLWAAREILEQGRPA